MPPQSPQTSLVWKHFTKDGETVRCKHCFKHFKNSGNTSNFWKHLNAKHNIFNRSASEADLGDCDDPESVEVSDAQSVLSDASSEGGSARRPSSAGSETRRPGSSNSFSSQPASPSQSPLSPPPSPSPSSRKRTASESGICRACGCTCGSSRKKQRSIDDSFGLQKSFEDGGSKSAELRDAMLFMVCKDRLPLSTPDKPGFQYFSQKAVPLWKPPSRQTTTRLLESKYASVSSLVKETLSALDSVCLTADCWTETHTTNSYLGCTAHYVKGIELESCILGLTHLTESHTADYLAKNFQDILLQWDIPNEKVSMVVTDSAENIKAAVRKTFGADRHNPCFDHLLNRIPTTAFEAREVTATRTLPDGSKESVKTKVENVPGVTELLKKVKSIVTFSRHSYNFSNYLKQLQMDRGKTEGTCLRLIQEVSTRWSSKYAMLERFLEMSDLISLAATRFTEIVMVTGAELASLRTIMQLLQPFAKATAEMSAEKSTTLSKVLPVVRILQQKLEAVEAPVDNLIARKLKNYMLGELNRRFEHIEKNRNMAAATLLDPRFKKQYFQSPVAMADALSYISDETKRIMRASAASSAASQLEREAQVREANPDDLWSQHETIVIQSEVAAGDDFPGGYPVELRQYLNKPIHSVKSNPFEIWETMKLEYPHLYPIARRFLSIMATSCPSERLFSGAGLIATDSRTRTTAEHLHQETFLAATSLSVWQSASGIR